MRSLSFAAGSGSKQSRPANFLAGIKSRKSDLNHVTRTQPASASPLAQPSASGGGMMAAIMAKGAQLKHVDTDKTGIAKVAALSRTQGGTHAAVTQVSSGNEPRPRARTKSNFRKSTFEGAILKKGWLQKRSTGKRF